MRIFKKKIIKDGFEFTFPTETTSQEITDFLWGNKVPEDVKVKEEGHDRQTNTPAKSSSAKSE